MARRIHDLLRSRLLAGEFGLDRLPDDGQLMREYRVGRSAIRAALSALQRDGLIERKQGTGTFARSLKARHRLVNANGFQASISPAASRVSTLLLAAEEQRAPAEVARELGLEPGARCLAVDCLTSIDGEPAVVLTSYLGHEGARDRVTDVLASGIWSGDWYDALGAAGLRPRRREVTVEAVALGELVAPLLDVAVGTPAIRFQRHLWLGETEIPEYGFSYNRGDLITFLVNDTFLINDPRG